MSTIHRPRPLRRAAALALALAGLLAAGAHAADPTAQDAAAGAYAFVGAHVLPMDRDDALAGHTVVVRDGRIAALGPDGEVEVPADARRIEAEGRWLLPGLAEMHGHVPGPDDPQYLEDVLFLYVSNGVTTVRNMAGHPSHPALRERIAAGEVLGPRLAVATPWVTPERVPDAAAARTAVAEAREAGFDLIKLGTVAPAVYPALAAAAREAGMPFGGHIPDGVGLDEALDARQSSIDHLDRYVEFLVPPGTDTGGRGAGFFGSGWIGLADPARLPDAVARTRAAGAWNVPTLTLVGHLASPEPTESMIAWPEMRYMPARVREGWVRARGEFAAREDFQPDAARRLVALRGEILKALHDGGAPIALGSDAPQFFNVPGFSIHREMAMMVDAGLTPQQVLVTGTRNPARMLGTPDAFGTIAPGRHADLILVEADPREDIAHLQRRVGVMVGGRWLPEAEIRRRLDAIAARTDGG
ncbi:amidohydrolase family protein [Luteimonas sp. Y-2-2-4F]|nr:amidohydrolase family protein [Luteimonas sp. Y-2-2-4F]MCD9030473.1 amidohydrolase family protein [Luteimonas sp. Y-2-2-4F]